MMQKRKSAGSTERTTERVGELTPLEEKVVRMRYGLKAPRSLVLERHDSGDPRVSAELDAIERRAVASVAAQPSTTKSKIVSALRKKTR